MERNSYFNLFEYFLGQTDGWGLVEDRFEKTRRQFRVGIKGELKSGELYLTENFLFDDGECSKRTWKIRRVSGDRYLGRADDMCGEAEGKLMDNAIMWKYKMELPVNGKKWKLDFEDRMFLNTKEVVFNHSKLKKFGIKVATVTIFFRKKSKRKIQDRLIAENAPDLSCQQGEVTLSEVSAQKEI